VIDWLIQNGETVVVLALVLSIPAALGVLYLRDRARRSLHKARRSMSDPAAVRRVRELVAARCNSSGYALLSRAEFFDGNHDTGSLAPNLSLHQGPKDLERFAAVLEGIGSRAAVSDVLVEASNDSGPDEWPVSEAVYVLTGAALDEVRKWLAPLRPDSVIEGTWHGTGLDFPELPEGARVCCAWWD